MTEIRAAVYCQWWVDCNRAATTMREHPLYGPVPICSYHNDQIEEESK